MFVGGDEDQLGARLDVDMGGGAEAVPLRHLDVHDDEVGRQRPDLVERLIAVTGMADHLDAFDVLKIGPQPIQRELLVVHQQDAH